MCEHVPSLIETSLSVIALASASSSASFAISSFNFLFIYDKCIIKSKLLVRTDVAAKAFMDQDKSRSFLHRHTEKVRSQV